MSKRDSYKGLDTLFAAGTVIQPDPARPRLWVQKLNSFEQEECRLDAQVKRTLVTSALRTPGSIEYDAVRTAVAKMGRDRLLDGIVQWRYSRYVSEATSFLQAQTEWQERLAVVDRAEFSTLPQEEQDVITDINRAYLNEMNDKINSVRAEDREKLSEQADDELRETYVDEWVDQRGADAFMRLMPALEIMWAVRMCDAESDDDGPEHHAQCAHDRLYEKVDEVLALPDDLKAIYNGALNRINVPVRLAKGSASQQDSSALSRPPSEEEESTRSIQEETQPEQGGISV